MTSGAYHLQLCYWLPASYPLDPGCRAQPPNRSAMALEVLLSGVAMAPAALRAR